MGEPTNSLVNSIDIEILMHRDIHFGGSFETMIEYYQNDGVGVMPDFEIEEIKKLQNLEREIKQNLSEIYLSEEAKTIIYESKKIYQDLRDVYLEDTPQPNAVLVSDLILTESENPEKEIRALIDKGKEVVPMLINLIASDSFYDPLYPGYGRTPVFSAKCLSEIQDERAIIPLFEALGHENFFTDEEMIQSLASFGDKSKKFLIKILKHFPISKDNEYAAIALSGFPEDEEIAKASLEVLENELVQKQYHFATYLVFGCANLIQSVDKKRFIAISKNQSLHKNLLDEMSNIIKSWESS